MKTNNTTPNINLFANFSTTFNGKYKNAEYEVVVEDNVITTAKIYMDGECTYASEITDEKGKELAYNHANLNAVGQMLIKEIDNELLEDGREMATDMTLITR